MNRLINSMTGYGSGVAQNDSHSITVEMRAVNHRFLEIYPRLPKQLLAAEDALKKQVQSHFSRGKIDIFITFEQLAAKKAVVTVDKELAMAYYNALSELAAYTSVDAEIKLSMISGFPGVLLPETVEDDVEQITALLQAAVVAAVGCLEQMRAEEGKALAADLLTRVDNLERMLAELTALAPKVVIEQKQRLTARIGELLDGVAVDEARLANEIAYFADKVDISEELTRFLSHIAQFRQSVSGEEAIGRKLEFILQEMLREINTIGSKSNALAINRIVIEVKSELEKIREQVQNVE